MVLSLAPVALVSHPAPPARWRLRAAQSRERRREVGWTARRGKQRNRNCAPVLRRGFSALFLLPQAPSATVARERDEVLSPGLDLGQWCLSGQRLRGENEEVMCLPATAPCARTAGLCRFLETFSSLGRIGSPLLPVFPHQESCHPFLSHPCPPQPLETCQPS